MSADHDTTGLDPSTVRGVEIRVECGVEIRVECGVEIRVECFHCSGSGRVRAGKAELENIKEQLRVATALADHWSRVANCR